MNKLTTLKKKYNRQQHQPVNDNRNSNSQTQSPDSAAAIVNIKREKITKGIV